MVMAGQLANASSSPLGGACNTRIGEARARRFECGRRAELPFLPGSCLGCPPARVNRPIGRCVSSIMQRPFLFRETAPFPWQTKEAAWPAN